MTKIMESNHFRKTHDLDIPDSMMQEWQSIVDLLARIGKIRAALIMRIREQELEVFLASKTSNNPYQAGHKERYIGSGLYCEEVIVTRKMLLVPDASKSARWGKNPDMKWNMKCYLGFPIRFPNGRCFGTICMLDDKENDFSQDMKDFMEKMRNLIESYLSLLQLSITDQLTGLYNRVYFERKVTAEIQSADRRQQAISALLLDIDHFKEINDTFGHLAGDRVLKNFAEKMNSLVRSEDVIFRLGGDEFYVLMPGTPLEEALKTAEILRGEAAGGSLYPGVPLTVSIGVAERTPGESVDHWCMRADQALYRVKNSSRNRVAY